jgi:hypothetical protein
MNKPVAHGDPVWQFSPEAYEIEANVAELRAQGRGVPTSTHGWNERTKMFREAAQMRREIASLEDVYKTQTAEFRRHMVEWNDMKAQRDAAEAALSRLREMLQEVDRWLGGWCITATCCASSGAELHQRVVETLAALAVSEEPKRTQP